MLIIKNILNKGRGVFTDTPIAKDDVIEICPILELSAADAEIIEQTIVGSYIYTYQEGRSCLVFGYGSLYNHSKQPNIRVLDYYDKGEFHVIAKRHIKAGEELLLDYDDENSGREIIFVEGGWQFADTGTRD